MTGSRFIYRTMSSRHREAGSLKTIVFCLMTLIVALVLTVLPVSNEWSRLSPQWVLLWVCFWCRRQVTPLSLFGLWCLGVYVDLLLTTPIGTHACVYVLVAWIVKTVMLDQHEHRLGRSIVWVVVLSLGQIGIVGLARWMIDAEPLWPIVGGLSVITTAVVWCGVFGVGACVRQLRLG